MRPRIGSDRFAGGLLLQGLFAITAAALAAGDDWPGIRGQAWDGHSRETGLVEAWPAAGPPVEWTRELGQGYSSFAAWDDRVATQYQSLAGQFVICLDAATGAPLWEHRYDWPYAGAGVYPGPRATPTYSAGRIYFTSPSGLVGCLDAASGRRLWELDLGRLCGCKLPGFGYACSPTVVDGKVFLAAGGTAASIVALDAATGAVEWTAGSDAASYASVLPVTFQGRPLVLGFLENVLVCHDRTTGERLWRHPLSVGYDEHSSWPLYAEPWLWISSPFRAGAELLELRGDPAARIVSHGRNRSISNDIFSSVLVGGAIYGFDVRDPQAKTHRSTRGVFRCVDLVSGAELWSAGDGRITRGGDAAPRGLDDPPGHATVIAADGKLILFNDLGELILVRASRERYEPLARASVLGGEICWTQPALSRQRLFVRNQSRAACLYLGDPAARAAEARPPRLTTADIPQRPYRDVAGLVLGVEPEYAFDIPSTTWLVTWYLACVGILVAAAAAVALLRRALVSGGAGSLTAAGSRSDLAMWGLVVIAGSAGTTLIGAWWREFVFTWPVAIFAAYAPLIERVRMPGDRPTRRDRRDGAIALVVFLTACAAYFLVCRRLSLVFEWAFLMGFPAAVPFSLAGRSPSGDSHHGGRGGWNLIWHVLAFTAFYWAGAAVLLVRGQPR